MHINQNSRDYFEWGDREDLSYEEKLAKYRELADDYFQVDAYREFCDSTSRTSTSSRTTGSPRRSSTTCSSRRCATFPAHEHEHFVAHYRGLLAAWATDDA